MNVVPRRTMNTNGGTGELTLKCKLKCYVKAMKNALGRPPLSLSDLVAYSTEQR